MRKQDIVQISSESSDTQTTATHLGLTLCSTSWQRFIDCPHTTFGTKFTWDSLLSSLWDHKRFKTCILSLSVAIIHFYIYILPPGSLCLSVKLEAIFFCFVRKEQAGRSTAQHSTAHIYTDWGGLSPVTSNLPTEIKEDEPHWDQVGPEKHMKTGTNTCISI